jgi:energy-coupling factor transporter ATP-binding protein EcfA2
MVTHNIDEATAYASRIVRLSDGHVVLDEKKEDVTYLESSFNDDRDLNPYKVAWSFANFNYVQGQKSIPSGTYIISGGCTDTAMAVVADGSVIARQYGAGETTFTITDNMAETYARFEMSTNKTFTSESSIIKPMIRLASDPDDTYVPYVPTNATLNE